MTMTSDAKNYTKSYQRGYEKAYQTAILRINELKKRELNELVIEVYNLIIKDLEEEYLIC